MPRRKKGPSGLPSLARDHHVPGYNPKKWERIGTIVKDLAVKHTAVVLIACLNDELNAILKRKASLPDLPLEVLRAVHDAQQRGARGTAGAGSSAAGGASAGDGQWTLGAASIALAYQPIAHEFASRMCSVINELPADQQLHLRVVVDGLPPKSKVVCEDRDAARWVAFSCFPEFQSVT